MRLVTPRFPQLREKGDKPQRWLDVLGALVRDNVSNVITFSVSLSVTIVGDGKTRNFDLDFSMLPRGVRDNLPEQEASGLALAQLIGPDGSSLIPATIHLAGRGVEVIAETPLQEPGANVTRYTLNLVLLYETK